MHRFPLTSYWILRNISTQRKFFIKNKYNVHDENDLTLSVPNFRRHISSAFLFLFFFFIFIFFFFFISLIFGKRTIAWKEVYM